MILFYMHRIILFKYLLQDYTLDKEESESYTLKMKKSRSFAKSTATEKIYGVKLGSSFDDKTLVDILPQLNKIFSDVLKKSDPPMRVVQT